MEREVTLDEVLAAREARARRQARLLAAHGLPLVSFTLNVAGPVKNGPLLRRAFQEGLDRLRLALQGTGAEIVRQEETAPSTGCEALLTVREDGRRLKLLCTGLEDEDALGRLFDLDVLMPDGSLWSREQLGLQPRGCLVCGREGKLCSSRRAHGVEELQAATLRILWTFFSEKDSEYVAAQATRALLYEVCVTPKPGLVDCANSGSHRDMDLFTFLDSTAALASYWKRAFLLGQKTAELEPEAAFQRLRRLGQRAEAAMFRATGGVNTHKGAVFSLGILCAVLGRLWTPRGLCHDRAAIFRECARLSAGTVADLKTLSANTAATAGRQLYRDRGLRGVRGELADGLPSVAKVGLPAMEALLSGGVPPQEAGAAVLLRLIANVTDTNLLARGGPEGLQWAAEQARRLLDAAELPPRKAIEELDREMSARNLSPGGCADLLAITYFLRFCEEAPRSAV